MCSITSRGWTTCKADFWLSEEKFGQIQMIRHLLSGFTSEGPAVVEMVHGKPCWILLTDRINNNIK